LKNKRKLIFGITLLLIAGLIAFTKIQNSPVDPILAYTVDVKSQNVQFYWKDENGEIFRTFQNLEKYVEKKNEILTFAMNGGMFQKDYSPVGLFIQNRKKLAPLVTSNGKGNFYLKPNGVFYVTTDNIPVVCKTTDFVDNDKIKYATQSGPMLVIDGKIHSAFKEGSKNVNIRNGVGVLPNKQVVFAMSKKEINFYDFAKYFKSLGCKNALYFDGVVSRTYFPEKNWIQTDGNFGVIIGVTVKNE
jgi:uncharacterized protein YigE (DUF2233 family)